jgi:hypothetical protein
MRRFACLLLASAAVQLAAAHLYLGDAFASLAIWATAHRREDA